MSGSWDANKRVTKEDLAAVTPVKAICKVRFLMQNFVTVFVIVSIKRLTDNFVKFESNSLKFKL